MGKLPSNSIDRKRIPIYSGVFKYFPDALIEIARVSQAGNDQHNPGEPLHWAREKSSDHHDALLRHIMELGDVDARGIRATANAAWRLLAILQLEVEAEQERIKDATLQDDEIPF